MRDILKTKNYFDVLLDTLYASQNRRLEKFKENKVKNDRVNNVKRAMATNYRKIVLAKYSRGDNMFSSGIYKEYKACIILLNESWEDGVNHFKYNENNKTYFLRQYSFSGYLGMLELLSLGILLNSPKKDIQLLIDIIDKDDIKDFLFEFLISYYDDERIDLTEESYQKFFHINERLGRLKTIIKEQSNAVAEKELKYFLENEWYNSFKDTPIYNSHKSNNNIYVGYWCFVAAAIVKIKKLDDSSFRDNEYYPKDILRSEI